MTLLRTLLLFCLTLTAAGLSAAPADEAPVAERIAVIDWGLAETLLGIGVTPLAVAELDNYRRWGSWTRR